MAQGLGIKYRCLLTKYSIAQAARLETVVQQSSNSPGAPRLGYEAWSDFLRSFVCAAQKVSTQTSSEVRCKTLDQEPMITCRYQSRIAPSLTFRQTVTLGRAVVDGRKSATVMPRVAVPVVSTVTGSRCVPNNSGLTA